MLKWTLNKKTSNQKNPQDAKQQNQRNFLVLLSKKDLQQHSKSSI